MTKKELATTLRVIKRAFPNHVLDVEAYQLWFALFENETAETFMTAILSAVKEPGRQFFPTPGEVNKYISLQKGVTMSAGEAWNLVYSNCLQSQSVFLEKHGGNQALEIATKQIGLRNIALAHIYDELPFLRKEFIRTYEQNAHKADQKINLQLSQQQAKTLVETINNALPGKTNQKLLG